MLNMTIISVKAIAGKRNNKSDVRLTVYMNISYSNRKSSIISDNFCLFYNGHKI